MSAAEWQEWAGGGLLVDGPQDGGWLCNTQLIVSLPLLMQNIKGDDPHPLPPPPSKKIFAKHKKNNNSSLKPVALLDLHCPGLSVNFRHMCFL